MPEPSSRKKSDALSVDQLVAIARQDRLPPGRRVILARTLAVLDPALLGELIARRNEVPTTTGLDPFVNALRRIFWPGRRLPQRHRQAQSAIGGHILSFSCLLLEEARTLAWRQLDPVHLQRMATWLRKNPLRREETRQSDLLALRAMVESTLATAFLRLGTQQASKLGRAIYATIEFAKPLPDDECASELSALLTLSLALFYTRSGCPDKAETALVSAEASLLASISEHRAILRVVEGVVAGLFSPADSAAGENYFVSALGELEPDSDPWLSLYIHHLAARMALSISLPAATDLEESLQRIARDMPLEELRLLEANRLMRAQADQQKENLDRARLHIELAEPLLEELACEELKMLHHWLAAHAFQIQDPVKAVESLFAAMAIASVRNDKRLRTMRNDLPLIFAQTSRIQLEPSFRESLVLRAIQWLEEILP